MKKSVTKKQPIKSQENILTVQKILDKEELKDFAERIVSEDIDNVIIIYRDAKENSIHWATTIKEWAMVFGSLSMVHTLILGDWENQHYQNEEDKEGRV